MKVSFSIDPEVKNLKVGLIEVSEGTVRELSESERREFLSKLEKIKVEGMGGGEARRTAVRKLLRAGGFKASGRNKPAQEYLWKTLQQNQWPFISNAVDSINLISVKSGLPISLISLDRLSYNLKIRYGKSGESFVFNRSGQELKIEGLISICEVLTDEPIGTPVKDSMKAKLTEDDKNFLACIYAPDDAVPLEELEEIGRELTELFKRYTAPKEISLQIIKK